jgi:acetyl esterase/lipase
MNCLPPARRAALALVFVLAFTAPIAQSQPSSGEGDSFEAETAQACMEQSAKVERVLSHFGDLVKGPAPTRKDLAYGSHPLQKLDVFLPPAHTAPAPIIVMVHGGGWCLGDKALKNVTKSKTAHYVPKGFVFVSVNYPKLPDGRMAAAQAEEVARAVAYVQHHARDWNGDERLVVLMGHSAGAHLVSLVNADARLRARFDVKPVLGIISLDSGATDAVKQISGMKSASVRERYLEAFGRDKATWMQASPLHQLDKTASPWLGVCSTRRADDPCAQARAFADKATSLGVRAAVLPQDKTHGQINADLGTPGAYTDGVDDFMASLDPRLRGLLAR